MDPNKRGNPPFEPSSYAAGLQRRVDRHTRWQGEAVAAARQMLDGTPEERAAGEAWWRGHFDQPEVVLSEVDAQSRSARADDEVARLTHFIDRDRYAAAIVLNNIKKVLAGYSWLSEAGRGPYAYDDERYQREFGDALEAIEAALTPLGNLAFDKTDCTTDPALVRAAREAGVDRTAQLGSDVWEDAIVAVVKISYPDRDLRLNPIQDTEREHWRPIVAAVLALPTPPARAGEVVEVLAPFALVEHELALFDENGWTDNGVSWSRERIGYWFGPTDFRRARALHEKLKGQS